MNAPSVLATDVDQANAEYDRLKPLRDIEGFVTKSDPTANALDALLMAAVIFIVLQGTTWTSQQPYNFWVSTLMMAAVALAFVYISNLVRAARKANQERWTLTAKMLRRLAQEVNELRAAQRR